jgi:hypothetical protein
MTPTFTTPQSIERSSAAQFVLVSGPGSAKVRETTTAFGADACLTAFRKRRRYSCDAPSPILERANASYVDGGQLSRNSAASAQTNWIGVADGPGSTGAPTRGVPTSYAALPLSKTIAEAGELPPVWPFADGKVRGYSFAPLHKNVPQAALADERLYELLALVDALRNGRARERNLASQELTRRLEMPTDAKS